MMKKWSVCGFLLISIFLFLKTESSFAQNPATDSLLAKRIHGYQIHLKQPGKEIRLLMYEKNFLPVHGRLSDDHNSIIMDNYEHGNKVHVKIIYEDGTTDEFVRSPCYIDPVINAL
jgi:hypothetical protein